MMTRREFGMGALGLAATKFTGGVHVRRAAALPTPPAGMIRVMLPSGRTFLLRQRASQDPGPAFVGFHITAHDASWTEAAYWVVPNHPEQSGWSRHAALRDYTLVLAEALGGQWNVGGGWPGGNQDDLGYAADVWDYLAARPNVDPTQVFAVGSSAGAALAWQACAQLPERYAAGAGFSGWAASYPEQPIDFYHLHGTADTVVPWQGGVGGGAPAPFTFPAMTEELHRQRRGSYIIHLVNTWGHDSTPGWAAQRVYDFCLTDRKR